MGMYTQARGWLNVFSIGREEHGSNAEYNLQEAKHTFKANYPNIRNWVCEDTVCHQGGNGSVYLFFGTELKNYNEDAQKWIEHLLTYFPSAEGRIDFQYEEVDFGDETPCWLIYNGEVIKKGKTTAWCKGYGNGL